MAVKLWENGYRSTMICIDSYHDRVPVGHFYNLYCPDGVSFRGVIDLIKKMEELLDQMKFPQSFSSIRSFSGKAVSNLNDVTEGSISEGELATFSVRILFRQNASWQGSVTWLDESREESFRSVLELILLMDSALTEHVEQ